jgi:hypothetical protein
MFSGLTDVRAIDRVRCFFTLTHDARCDSDSSASILARMEGRHGAAASASAHQAGLRQQRPQLGVRAFAVSLARRSLRETFPEEVMGNSATNSMCRGTL